MSARVAAWIGVGSNLDGPAARVRAALDALAQLPRTRVQARSGLYRSAPMGPADQPEFINAVAGLETALAPHALLDELQALEDAAGRVRGGPRWGPRTLDLDLLLYGERWIADARLTVPHPGIAERAFVLVPLAAVAPTLEIPGAGRVADLAATVPAGAAVPLEAETAS